MTVSKSFAMAKALLYISVQLIIHGFFARLTLLQSVCVFFFSSGGGGSDMAVNECM